MTTYVAFPLILIASAPFVCPYDCTKPQSRLAWDYFILGDEKGEMRRLALLGNTHNLCNAAFQNTSVFSSKKSFMLITAFEDRRTSCVSLRWKIPPLVLNVDYSTEYNEKKYINADREWPILCKQEGTSKNSIEHFCDLERVINISNFELHRLSYFPKRSE